MRPEWCVVDRVIARRDAEAKDDKGDDKGKEKGKTKEKGSEYLVKWKGLGCGGWPLFQRFFAKATPSSFFHTHT